MIKKNEISSHGNDRLGLKMIAASLIAIALIIAIHLWYQKSTQTEQVRIQGVSLTRALAGLPFDQLIPENSRQSLISTVFQSQNDPNFAYAAIIDANNVPVTVATAPGVVVPPMEMPSRPAGWLSDRMVTTGDGHEAIEFYAPLYNEGSVDAYLRLGYFLPQFGINREQLPFFATLALIIFLLTPFFYLLVRQEIRPLRQASSNISNLIDSQQFKNFEQNTSGDFGDFLGRFNVFVESARERIAQLESEQEKLQTSKKLITYSKLRIENVLETIPEAVIILDQSGKVSYANQRVESLLGVAHVDVIASDLGSWCDEPALLDVISGFAGMTAASYLSETVRLDIGKSKGRKLAIKAYPLFSPGESTAIHGSLIVIRDVTKESEKKRRHGEFVSHVAHELKTPLNTLALYAESMLGEEADDPQVRIESANIMHDEVERLAGLIDNLLNITKIETGEIAVERKRLRLGEFLQDAFNMASRGNNPNKLKFEIDLPSEVSPILADKDLFRIAINNLLTNAVKYSQPGGLVHLVCEETEQSTRIMVRDTGIGIAEEEQSHIFDRFYRSNDAATRQRSGHGLGLSLAQDIVQLHHGTLTVNSSLGEGSEFVIEIWKESGLLQQVI